MLLKLGRAGHPNDSIGSTTAIVIPTQSYTPLDLSPLLLLDSQQNADSNSWSNLASAWPGGYQADSSKRPVIQNDAVEFDGVNDHFSGAYSDLTPTNIQILPDGAGSTAGRGITCTGLAYDASDDTFWIANHGQATSSSPFTPSIMNVSKDGQTNLSEILLKPLFPAIESVQGLVVDTSDNSLWFVSRLENLVRHVSKAGVDLGSIAVPAVPNGLAYDSRDNSLLVMLDNGDINRYNTATGGQIGNMIVNVGQLGLVDMLYLDDVQNVLWISYGLSGSAGNIRAYSIDTGILSDPIILDDVQAIEGIYLDGTTLYVTDDGHFHNQTFNQLVIYDFDPSGVISTINKIYTEMEFTFVFKIGGISGPTETILALGDPLQQKAFALFLKGNTDDTVRFFINDGVQPIAFLDITCAQDFSSYSIISVKIDFANRSVSLYQNGVLQGQQPYNNDILPSISYADMSIAALPNGDRATHIDFKDICVTEFLLNAGQNNELGQHYADKHSLNWTGM